MTTDSVFILFKDWFHYNFSLFRGKVYQWWGHKFFVAEIVGHNFIDADFL